MAFQRNHHLVVDRVVGSQTWRSLIITVGQGSHGDAVRAVQDQINFRDLKVGRTLAVDGAFGPRTRAWSVQVWKCRSMVVRAWRSSAGAGGWSAAASSPRCGPGCLPHTPEAGPKLRSSGLALGP